MARSILVTDIAYIKYKPWPSAYKYRCTVRTFLTCLRIASIIHRILAWPLFHCRLCCHQLCAQGDAISRVVVVSVSSGGASPASAAPRGLVAGVFYSSSLRRRPTSRYVLPDVVTVFSCSRVLRSCCDAIGRLLTVTEAAGAAAVCGGRRLLAPPRDTPPFPEGAPPILPVVVVAPPPPTE